MPRLGYGQTATAIDGNSLRVGDQEIRLIGIDAPELKRSSNKRLQND